MDIQKWHEQRRKGLGGSDSPVVLGVSPFKSPHELWLEKTGRGEDQKETLAMKRGKILEPVIADLYAEETGQKLRRVNCILQHDDLPYIQANLDRQILSNNGAGPGVLEIKCPGLHIFGKCKREGLPDYCSVQLQHYMSVTGYKWGAFAVFNPERWEMIHFTLERDDALIRMILQQDKIFWEKVLRDEPPEDDGPAVDLPPVGGELIRMAGDVWEKAIDDLRSARELKAEAEAVEKMAKEAVTILMERAGADVAEGAGARIYFKQQAGRKKFDKERLAADHPEIDLAAYEKQGKPFKAFRPYFLKTVE